MVHSLAYPNDLEASPFPNEIRVLGELFPEYYCDYLEQCTKQVLFDFFGPDFGQLCVDPYSELPLVEAIFPVPKSDKSDQFGVLRIALFCEGNDYTKGAGRHMVDLFHRWLVPGETLTIPCSLTVHFIFAANPGKKFFLCHLLLSLDSKGAFFRAQKEIGHLIKVLKETISCVSRLRKSLGKNLPKLAPKWVWSDLDFFEHASHLLKDGKRNQTLVARIMGLHCLFYKQLQQKILDAPHLRHVALKIFPLKYSSEPISSLGVLVGISLIREGEIFEEKHLLKALRRLIADAQLVSPPFVYNAQEDQKIKLLYVEVKKESGFFFSRSELLFLRTQLPKECLASVEVLIHPLFMPRNDEDLLRFSLQLCRQLDEGPTLPQLAIFFGNQTAEILCFSVILARIVEKGHSMTLLDALKRANPLFECVDVELRFPPCTDKQAKKEVVSFTAKLPKDHYFRSDYAIDVLQARQEIVKQIQEIFGPVRDFNGGLFESQLRAEQLFLTSLEATLGVPGQREIDLAKNFFHAITPTLMQIILDTSLLKKIFLSLLQATGDKTFTFCSLLEPRHEILILKSPTPGVKKEAQKIAEALSIPSSKLAYSLVEHGGEHYLVTVHQHEGERHLFLTQKLCHL